MTVTGKVQKFLIRQQEVRERGLTQLEPGAAGEHLSTSEGSSPFDSFSNLQVGV